VEGDLQRLLGYNVRKHREALDVSQEALAHQLGMHRTYMGGIERGERNLSLKALERLAEQLGVEPLDLLAPKR
jgi:transcriptional regulator with XRE-family HTH domain